MEMRGKVALVTGGAHRVGRAITLMLAAQGAHVAINYFSSAEAAQQTAAAAEALGVQALAVQADVGDFAQVDALATAIEQRFGGVDIIVNSADLFAQHPFPTDDLSVWRRVTAISIDGPYYVCNRLAPGMLERGGGAIVNIVDLSAWEPWPKFTAHAVSKAALLALTRQLALELGPTIRANAVAPGPVLPPPNYRDRAYQAAAQRALLERWGSAEDVAKAVRYLIEADYVTADVVTVDGGERYGHRKSRSPDA